MTPFPQVDPLWASPIAIAAIALGLMLVWRGLRGGRDGGHGLLGQRIDMLHRIEGFRLTVFGLVLIGAGAAVIWQARWLVILALGIGFVEILESSTLIAVWKANRPDSAREAQTETTARQSGGRPDVGSTGIGEPAKCCLRRSRPFRPGSRRARRRSRCRATR